MKDVIIIIGPTASGKTSFAIDLAQKLSGEIINFDSLQVYQDLKLLTAFPSEDELKTAKHKLFGYLKFYETTSSVDWAKKAAIEIKSSLKSDKTPILVGGTGLYINTLIYGINNLPNISNEIRTEASNLATKNFDLLCKRVLEKDPNLKITKDQHHQMIRAYEILLQTGLSIRYFYEQPKQQFIENINFKFHTINVDRQKLYSRIESRFDKMLCCGAIEQVRDLLKETNGSENYPIFKAIGAKEIAKYLKNLCSFDEMREKAIKNSRHYAKRQMTWIRHQLPNSIVIHNVFS